MPPLPQCWPPNRSEGEHQRVELYATSVKSPIIAEVGYESGDRKSHLIKRREQIFVPKRNSGMIDNDNPCPGTAIVTPTRKCNLVLPVG